MKLLKYAESIDEPGNRRERLTAHKLSHNLWVMSEFRNVCAHDERFFSHTIARVRSSKGQQVDVSELTEIMKMMLAPSDVQRFESQLKTIVEGFSSVDVDSQNLINLAVASMGFDEKACLGQICHRD